MIAMSEMPNPSHWVELYGDDLFSYARWKVADEESAQDLVQETFLSALKSLSTFRGESQEKTWLFSILKHKISDHYRKLYARAPHESLEKGEEKIQNWFSEDGHWKAERKPHVWKSDEKDVLESKEFYTILSSCRDKLNKQQQVIFALKYLEDRDADEICKELSISTSNYWVIIHRARLQLRECLEINWLR